MREIKAIRQLRHIGLIEGTSTLLLFFVAMPLKYAADMPKAVSIVGMIHGLLFILYVIALIRAAVALKRPFGWSAKVFIAAIIPFCPFVIERGLRREETELATSVSE
jgi:integral membrane protein